MDNKNYYEARMKEFKEEIYFEKKLAECKFLLDREREKNKKLTKINYKKLSKRYQDVK